MAQPQLATIRRLDIDQLGLDEDHEPYSDGVACIQVYWAYSMDLSQRERDNMRNLILDHHYYHTVESREEFYEHRLCRDPAGKTRPGLILLRALYKAVPVDFENDVVARCGHLSMRNRSDEYFALFPDTVGPPVFDMDTDSARQYQGRYPLLKVTPSTHRNRDQDGIPLQDTPSPMSTSSPVPSIIDDSDEIPTQNPVDLLQPLPVTATEANRPVTRLEFDRLCRELATTKAELATTKAEVTAMRTEMTTMKEDMTTMRADMMTLRDHVILVKEDIEVLAISLYRLRQYLNLLP
ncbi:hypothetical protein A0O28_0055030 [Trichoderma guizhouense]|uniref:Uncharacterized protein n=1 Tax=Trichoderma guizhouense TaxID=1491466 RepID=A0A1T3C5R2_9HYPO|nr:hypothetical protein A0O28_0055030 [Trichoderma guizhouense]